MAGPSPADGVAQAVRRVRLAAGSLAGPLDAFTVVAAAAESLPDVLNPALESLMPSPFGGIAGLLGDAGASQGGGAAGGAARSRPASPAAAPAPAPAASPPSGPAARANAALGVLGKFVTDELSVLGVTAAPAAAPAPQSPFGEILQAFDQQVAAVMSGNRSAPPPSRQASSPEELILEQFELLMARGVIAASPPTRARAGADLVARRAGVPKPLLPVVRGAATAIGSGVQLLEELTGTAPPAVAQAPQPAEAPSQADGVGGAFAALGKIVGELGAPSAAASPNAPQKTAAKDALATTTLEQERRKLLDVIAAAEQASAAAAPPQPGSATADDDVAWLVNEALVEQARLHGVDLR